MCHLCLLALCVVWGWDWCAVHLDWSVAPVVSGVLVPRPRVMTIMVVAIVVMAIIIGHNGRCHAVLRVVMAPRNS